MNFFPPDPAEDEIEPANHVSQPWWKPSDGELAAIFPVGETIAINDTVAVILTMARVYSNGVEFAIDRRIRRGGTTRREWQEMHNQMHGHFMGHDPDRLRYGAVLGDGQKLIADWSAGMFDSPPERHTLTQTGGGGGGGEDSYRFDDALWLWPLPPAGPIEVVVQWPALDVPESHVVLDSAPLIALAAQARPVWSDA